MYCKLLSRGITGPIPRFKTTMKDKIFKLCKVRGVCAFACLSALHEPCTKKSFTYEVLITHSSFTHENNVNVSFCYFFQLPKFKSVQPAAACNSYLIFCLFLSLSKIKPNLMRWKRIINFLLFYLTQFLTYRSIFVQF